MPLCVHAEQHTLGSALLFASMYQRPLHVCHVARKQEIQLIKIAKENVLGFFENYTLKFNFVIHVGPFCHLRSGASPFVPIE